MHENLQTTKWFPWKWILPREWAALMELSDVFLFQLHLRLQDIPCNVGIGLILSYWITEIAILSIITMINNAVIMNQPYRTPFFLKPAWILIPNFRIEILKNCHLPSVALVTIPPTQATLKAHVKTIHILKKKTISKQKTKHGLRASLKLTG